MIALLFALLGVLLFGGIAEGTARTSSVVTALFFAKLGKVRVGMRSYRQGRVYYWMKA